MKNLLLVGALCSLTLLPSTAAQSFDENPAQRRVEVIQTARKSIRSEAARTLKTYEQNGRKIAVKETLDGKRRFKAFANQKENLAPVYTAQKEAMPAADEEYTLAEGFEEFANHIDDPDALEWLPEGWTSINTHPNYDDPDALWYSWYITEPSIAKGLPLNPESQYIAYIQYDEYEESDEWLITKPITVKEEDYLFFDLSYLPCYVFYNFYNKDDGIAATMKIKISDNGGESWDLLLDVADLEYTDEELEISDFRRFRIDISDYAGKTVLIAFQYEGVYGDSMQLDEVYVRPMLPTAIYNRPQGTFLSGVNYKWDAFLTTSIFAPAFKDLVWNNYSNEALSYQWDCDGENYDTPTYTANYSIGTHSVPSLTATSGSRQSSYTWNGTLTAGRAMTIGNLDVNNNRLTVLSYNDVPAPRNYVFGSCELDMRGYHITTKAVMNIFEKPCSPMLISGVDLILATFEAPDDAEFFLRAVALTETGELGDTLAIASLKASDVEATELGGYYGYGMHFEFLKEVNGTPMPQRLLIDEPMAYIFDGFDRDDVVVGVVSNSVEQTFDAGAYVYRLLSKEGEEDMVDISSMGSYSLAMSLCNASMSSLGADKSVSVPGTAGTSAITVYSTLFMADGIDCTVADSWLTTGTPTDKASGQISIPISFEALPEGTTQRSTTLTVSTLYADPITIEVIQDQSVSGITGATILEGLYVAETDGELTICHAQDRAGKLAIYNMQGVNVATADLSTSGTTTLDIDLESGIYVAVAQYADGGCEKAKFIKR